VQEDGAVRCRQPADASERDGAEQAHRQSAQQQLRLWLQRSGLDHGADHTDTYLYNARWSALELRRQQNGTTSRYWYVLEGRGNVEALTDGTGNVVNRYSYDHYDHWGALTDVSESVL
jgi:hypothetical protein